MGSGGRQRRGENRCLKIKKKKKVLSVVSRVEDEPLLCGNKIAFNCSHLFHILSPGRVSFILCVIAE